jgi:hemoglobin
MSQTIFERYGGFSRISRVVSEFYSRVMDNGVVSSYFRGVDMRTLIDHQTKFFATLMGGPASYTDEHLARVHAHLHITEDAFVEMAALLRDTLEDFDLDATDVAIVHGAFMARKPYVLNPHGGG